jgi:carboxyl-terminal processing protease
MTTAKYYTPSHRTIHENGVVPNIVATMTPAQEEGLARWFNRDTISPEDRKQAEKFRDPQLIRAVDAMKGALVYSQIQGVGTGSAADAEERASDGEKKPGKEKAKATEAKQDREKK